MMQANTANGFIGANAYLQEKRCERLIVHALQKYEHTFFFDNIQQV